jgi:hypothetical protein
MQVLRVGMAWCWVRARDWRGSRGALRPFGGKGSAQGLENNVEEMGASPKVPALTSAHWTVMSRAASDAEYVAGNCRVREGCN